MQALGVAMCKLLRALTRLYPLAIAPCTPPSLAAALTQLVASTDCELQVRYNQVAPVETACVFSCPCCSSYTVPEQQSLI
jgi:hypothetical protein